MAREDVTVAKLCGTNSNKDTVMEGFGSGRSQQYVAYTVQVHSLHCIIAQPTLHR